MVSPLLPAADQHCFINFVEERLFYGDLADIVFWTNTVLKFERDMRERRAKANGMPVKNPSFARRHSKENMCFALPA